MIAKLESGVWRSSTPPGTRVVDYPLTAAGRERLESFRLDQDPALRCEAPGMPRGFMPVSPMTFDFEKSTLTIRYETMDVVRAVHMDGAPLPQNAAHTPNGHAVGRWEDDRLIIETTHLAAGEVDRNGTPKSAAMTLREVYAVEDRDGGRYLIVALTITDPEYFRVPFSSDYEFVFAPDWELLPFECEPTVY
jgi:hypothetical protein